MNETNVRKCGLLWGHADVLRVVEYAQGPVIFLLVVSREFFSRSLPAGSYQVGALKRGLCGPHVAPLRTRQ